MNARLRYYLEAGYLPVMILLGAAFFAADRYSLVNEDAPIWPHLLTFTVASAGLLFLRKRLPLIALGIGLLATAVDGMLGITIPVLLILADLLYSATLYSRRRIAYGITAVVLLVAVALGAAAAANEPDWRLALLTFLQISTPLTIPVAWALNVRWYREAARAERERAEQVAQLAELDRRAAVTAERSRLAADLHDVIASHLSAIAIQSEAALSMVRDDPKAVTTVLRSVRENSVESLSEMREMIELLSADQSGETSHEDPPTAPARLRDLDRLLDSATASGLDVRATVDPDGAVPVAVDLAAYRIVQESLTNVAKHAPAARTTLTIGTEPAGLVVEISNELTTHLDTEDSDGGGGTGLVSMRARAEAVGGTLSAGRYDVDGGDGWKVRAVLPAHKGMDEL